MTETFRNVAEIDARGAFTAAAIEGGRAVVCTSCHAWLRLEGGLADARDMKHAETCVMGKLFAGIGKPVIFRDKTNEVRN